MRDWDSEQEVIEVCREGMNAFVVRHNHYLINAIRYAGGT
jgi:hypothetical protein